MFWNEVVLYIRENHVMVMAVTVGVIVLALLIILFQVTRTRREVHKICKKIRKYFDVILTEEVEENIQETEKSPQGMPAYQSAQSDRKDLENEQKENEIYQKQRDAKLLMDVISDVF